MIEATCSACGTVNRVAEGDLPAGAKFLTCSSCKARVMLKTAPTTTLPRAAALPPVPTPKPPPVSAPKPPAMPRAGLPAKPAAAAAQELADLPAPKRQSPLAGIEASKPAPKSGLDIVDLPAPKSAKPLGGTPALGSALGAAAGSGALDLDDVGADLSPVKKTAMGLADLPAPKRSAAPPVAQPPARTPASNDIVDLPAPKSPAGLADFPAPRRPGTPPVGTAAMRPPATPAGGSPAVRPPGAPASRTPATGMPAAQPASMPTVRAAAPSAPTEIVDLPAPKGISDLPVPKPGASGDLPAPKGFFDDLPQPAAASKQAKVDLPAPKGFFDDLPQPAKGGNPALPAPKGFFDDLPQPTKPTTPSPPVPKGPAAKAPEAKGFFDDLPDISPSKPATTPPPMKPAPPASAGVFDDLPEPTKSASDFDTPELDLGPPVAASSSAPPGGHGALDLDPGPELDLGLPTAPQKDVGARGDFADLDLSKPTALPPPAAQAKSGITIKPSAPKPSKAMDGSALNALPAQKLSGDLQLDLEDDPTRPPVGAAAVAKRTEATTKKPAKAAAKETAAKPRRTKLILGVVLGVAALGGGGFFGYKRYADKKAREAEITEHIETARKAIHDGLPTHWNRAANEASAVLEVDETNIDAIGLRAEALIGGALDNGVSGESHKTQGHRLLADALEQNITGPQLETAQVLDMIARNQADRAVPKLEQMTKREPKNGFLWLYLGWAQVAKGDAAAAVKSFDTAIAADPKCKLPALYARGKAKLLMIDLEGAKADFGAVLEQAKDHIGAQVGLAASLPAAQSSQREADLLAILARKDINAGDPRAVVQAWTLAADVARTGGRLDVARERYRQALNLSKLDVPALDGLARVELRDGKTSVAADLVQKALSQSADNPDALLVAAELYIKQGKLSDANAIAMKLATRQPPLPPLQMANLKLVVGDVLEAQDKSEEAIEAWVEGAKLAGDLDLSPMMAAVTKLGALAKKAADNHDDKNAAEYRARADQLLSSLADRAQEDAQLSKALGAAYLGAGDPVKAEKFLARSVEMRNNDIESRLELASALAQLNRTDDALAQLKAAQDLDPKRKDIALDIATTLEGAKRDDDALAAYAKLLADKDVTVQARVHAGRFFARKKDYKRAGEQGDPILAAEPDNPAGHYLRGEGYLAVGKLDEARKELLMAVDGDPNPQYYDAQGRAAEASVPSDSKYYDLALHAYSRAIELDPKQFNAQAGLGRVHIARKEWTQAITPLGLANKLEPKDAEVMYNIGLAYKNLGQPGTAVDWLVAASRDKADADTYWQLGQLYRDGNRGGEAATALAEATRLGKDKETKTGTKVEWLTDAYYELGEIQDLLHNGAATRAAFQAFVERNPPPSAKLSEAKRRLATDLKSP